MNRPGEPWKNREYLFVLGSFYSCFKERLPSGELTYHRGEATNNVTANERAAVLEAIHEWQPRIRLERILKEEYPGCTVLYDEREFPYFKFCMFPPSNYNVVASPLTSSVEIEQTDDLRLKAWIHENCDLIRTRPLS